VGGTQTSNVATVTLTTAPVANDDWYELHHDTELDLDASTGVLGNDAGAGTLQAVLLSGPQHGALTLNGDGSLRYVPAAGYVGDDSFTYEVQADGQTSNAATVSLSIEDQAPSAGDDTFEVHAGQTLPGETIWRYELPQPGETIWRYELPALLEGRLRPGPGVELDENGLIKNGSLPTPFADADPVYDRRFFALASEFPGRVYFDYLPTAKNELQALVLTNARGRLRPVGEAGAISAAIIEQTREEAEKPCWSLTVYRTRSHWDAKEKEWRYSRWLQVESIPVRFKESFRVVGQRGDYYFITRSGKVYVAKRPPKGKPRRLLPVWTDARRPIVAYITDADTGRTFLFVKPASPRDKPTFFALAARPKPEVYDPALVLPQRGKEPLRSVLRYARLLVALKKIKPK
jgi:hypothetical protein